MKRIVTALICVLLLFSLGACKPRYVSPVESPAVGMDADAPYEIDFVQVHNDIVDIYAEDSRFPYIKNVVIDGSNDPKVLKLNIEVVDGTSQEAIDFFIATMLINVGYEVNIQDSRFTLPSDEGFGSFYDMYALQISVSCDGSSILELSYPAGEGLPYDQTVSEVDDTDE